MKTKLDEESRVVMLSNIRDERDIKPKDEVVISKPLSPEEFLEEAHILAEDIRKKRFER
jgi:SET domain-containing protein